MTDRSRELPALGDPDPTPVLENNLEYCWAPRFIAGRNTPLYCSWSRADGHPGRPHVGVLSGRVRAIWTDDAPPPGRTWSPRDTYPLVAGPDAQRPPLGDDEWTDEMTRRAAAAGTRRQCSIGWHVECSDRAGAECRCACHGCV